MSRLLAIATVLAAACTSGDNQLACEDLGSTRMEDPAQYYAGLDYYMRTHVTGARGAAHAFDDSLDPAVHHAEGGTNIAADLRAVRSALAALIAELDKDPIDFAAADPRMAELRDAWTTLDAHCDALQ